ncbi:uncharacterized protein B0I36DRAFT_316722 [Microdochium trichocladiopsis]|uniref:Uncharacterized protein n=1 Tax=Microdochium trichocladiopsis TaxID=1682393 RepID=A0A9P9BSJ9_9PEZI|nr:uncharacterized protein B0I36DRAFT_316722 [Microdochium trichocladiopsis]KAH7034664.1 hypothetical protein B0I36DRAFT_316722 [Microdochium trichocladiopsis]
MPCVQVEVESGSIHHGKSSDMRHSTWKRIAQQTVSCPQGKENLPVCRFAGARHHEQQCTLASMFFFHTQTHTHAALLAPDHSLVDALPLQEHCASTLSHESSRQTGGSSFRFTSCVAALRMVLVGMSRREGVLRSFLVDSIGAATRIQPLNRAIIVHAHLPVCLFLCPPSSLVG